MAIGDTIQTGIKRHTQDSISDYALFMGGTNVIHDVLTCYDPLKTGYARIFMVRQPVFLEDLWDKTASSPLKKFKHILEYGFTAINGFSDISVDFNAITGGYVGKSFEIPSVAKDDTTSFQITVYEFTGSPVREVLHTWINGTTDVLTGLTHYNGAETDVLQANNTAEFIYVTTDATGKNVEYACLLANCFPRGINTSAFTYESGSHNLVEMPIDFTCTKYESVQINKVAKALLDKYQILSNSLNFYSGYDPGETDLGGTPNPKGYDVKTGKLREYQTVNGRTQYVNS